MHLLLTDRLSCPRCGPEFGLILLADRLEDRRVLHGTLGCPNCRDAFPVRDGFGDLRAPPRREMPEGLAGMPGGEGEADTDADKVIALLGVTQGPGTLALVGAPSRHARALADRVDDVHVLAIDPDQKMWPESNGVSRLMATPGLPVYSLSLRGIAIDGRLGSELLAEAARVVVPKGRVVVVHAGAETAKALESHGLEVLATEAGTVVAARS
ncbi:MAG: hypothetical protein U5R14_13175 [Gemmatimonadota bacterium]|nr:hypothetical protein [Gemmatimonadota bacterium]